jgi:hypothetical protein
MVAGNGQKLKLQPADWIQLLAVVWIPLFIVGMKLWTDNAVIMTRLAAVERLLYQHGALIEGDELHAEPAAPAAKRDRTASFDRVPHRPAAFFITPGPGVKQDDTPPQPPHPPYPAGGSSLAGSRGGPVANGSKIETQLVGF